ncbi:MAG: hypothetical protein ABJG47_02440 [Ekhidna sp.]
MIHFVLVLTLAFSGINSDSSATVTESPSIEFSKPAAEFESGQPVYPKGTKAFLRNLTTDKSRVVINDKVDEILKSQRVDVSRLVDLSEGTYTVMIESPNGSKETFGFTIK